jgi:hypothetical protein
MTGNERKNQLTSLTICITMAVKLYRERFAKRTRSMIAIENLVAKAGVVDLANSNGF